MNTGDIINYDVIDLYPKVIVDLRPNEFSFVLEKDEGKLAGDDGMNAGDDGKLAGDEGKLAGDEGKLAGDEGKLAGDDELLRIKYVYNDGKICKRII